ncbi:hypothetical protein SARC_07360 [Sphaeroforma arctica JP610]|uniref:Zinc finger PHD-type domain-containing protein n=1 Tax=Sphaeroforma arctica JP610 TaxID=667725 RepID=A0A0L0FTW3_9EUKA|nr:hypothetical protein SARC_07360 [Sphaeroforma arctica JP610]KNC80280.1 hypothetical protein SARC_07360 [Sphaeroforma arctica JP610]|eukprot:XP_014154182.1 hypothetical protein SARC_07360 [Sphaeroforma arctica JP610]
MEVLQKASSYIRRLHQQVNVNTTEMDTLIYRNTDLMSRLAAITKSRNLPWPAGQPQYTPPDVSVNGHQVTHTPGGSAASSINRTLQPMTAPMAHSSHYASTPVAPPPSLSYDSGSGVNSAGVSVSNGFNTNGTYPGGDYSQSASTNAGHVNGVHASATHTNSGHTGGISAQAQGINPGSYNPVNDNPSSAANRISAPPKGTINSNGAPSNNSTQSDGGNVNGVSAQHAASQSITSASPSYIRPVYISQSSSNTEFPISDPTRARTSMSIKTEFTKPAYTGRRDSSTSSHSVSSSLPNIGPRKRSVHVAESNNYYIEPRLRKISRSEVDFDRDDDLEADAALLTDLHNERSNSVFKMDMDSDRKTSPDSQPCKCGKPWDGKPMVMCEECMRWLHGACAGLMGRQHFVNYVCIECQQQPHPAPPQA